MALEIREETYAEYWRAVRFTANYNGQKFRCYVPIEDLFFKTGDKALEEFRKSIEQVRKATELAIARATEISATGQNTNSVIKVCISVSIVSYFNIFTLIFEYLTYDNITFTYC
jgi:hypothetical protein